MASLSVTKLKKGDSYRVIFHLCKERRQVFLGADYTRAWAEEVCRKVDQIARSVNTGEPLRASVKAWIEEAGEDLRIRLERAGLIELPKRVTLDRLWTEYLSDASTSSAAATIRHKRTVRNRFLGYFAGNRLADTVTPREAAEYHAQMRQQYAEGTCAGIVTVCKTVFNWAVDHDYIDSNPFAKVKRGSFVNEANRVFIPLAWYFRLLDASPDQEWRAIISLCRIGGLRNPSETLLLKWSDINWSQNKLLVHSPKTKRHIGHEQRLIPLFPLLRKELESLFEQAEEGGSPYVISRYRGSSALLRNHFERIVFYAGLEQWPLLFQNMRISRSNEVLREYGSIAESRWIGHSPKVAERHYSVLLESEFDRAIRDDPSGSSTDYAMVPDEMKQEGEPAESWTTENRAQPFQIAQPIGNRL